MMDLWMGLAAGAALLIGVVLFATGERVRVLRTTEGLDFAFRQISAARAKKKAGQHLTHDEQADLVRVAASAIEKSYPTVAEDLRRAADARATQLIGGQPVNLTSALLSARVLACQDAIPSETEEAALIEDLYAVLVARVAYKPRRVERAVG